MYWSISEDIHGIKENDTRHKVKNYHAVVQGNQQVDWLALTAPVTRTITMDKGDIVEDNIWMYATRWYNAKKTIGARMS